MPDLADLSATEARRRMDAGSLSPRDLLEACLARIAAREPTVQAMAFLPPSHSAPAPGPLHGLPLGVKDVLDTADMPSGYGSPIWAGWRPRADAAPVAAARTAGATVLGKTVTTEFATRMPGPTTNPHGAGRTPGGSSSGSAAGVAAGFFPFAFGTQTAGSIVRPAAFCGVVGFKPSFGLIDRHGMKVMSASLDTVGTIARTVPDCALLAAAASGADLGDPARRVAPPRIGVCWTSARRHAAPETIALVERAATTLALAGATVVERDLPPEFGALDAAHPVVMNAESAHAMAWERATAADRLSDSLRERLEWGLAQGFDALHRARRTLHGLRAAVPDAMDGVDLLLTPAAPGEAPDGLGWTGDPAFNLVWTSLHLPCITVPAGHGPNGMPLGVQLVARFGADRDLLSWAEWAHHALG